MIQGPPGNRRPFFVQTIMHPNRILLGTSAASLILGSVHAYSVFLIPLEATLGLSRSAASLPYSVALVSISLSVLCGPWIYGRINATALIGGALLLAAAGLVVAALAPSLPVFVIGFGILFGLANGLGYGFGLQLAAHAWRGHEGFAMGSVTAAYALGAASAAYPLSALTQALGVAPALFSLAAACALTALIASAALITARARFLTAVASTAAQTPLLRLWLAYTCAVAAGLMTIGHATALLNETGMNWGWIAPILIAIGNLIGSFWGGTLGDRISIARLLSTLGATAAVALIASAAIATPALALLSLFVIGTTYGATIALFPALISKRFGTAAGPAIYGRVFTGWGLMGFVAPWIAGALHDASGSYQASLLAAAACALAAAALSRTF